jgi:hypothetical protein
MEARGSRVLGTEYDAVRSHCHVSVRCEWIHDHGSISAHYGANSVNEFTNTENRIWLDTIYSCEDSDPVQQSVAAIRPTATVCFDLPASARRRIGVLITS